MKKYAFCYIHKKVQKVVKKYKFWLDNWLETFVSKQSVYQMIGEGNMFDLMGDSLTSDERVSIIFGQMDKDGNEKISTQEFFDGIKKNPQLLKLMPMGKYNYDEKSIPA